MKRGRWVKRKWMATQSEPPTPASDPFPPSPAPCSPARLQLLVSLKLMARKAQCSFTCTEHGHLCRVREFGYLNASAFKSLENRSLIRRDIGCTISLVRCPVPCLGIRRSDRTGRRFKGRPGRLAQDGSREYFSGSEPACLRSKGHIGRQWRLP